MTYRIAEEAGGPGKNPRATFDEAAQETRQAADQAREQATSLASDMSETAKAAARAVKEQTAALASNVRSELEATADQQKLRGADAISGFAHAVTTAASELETHSPLVARYVREAANQVDGFSSHLRSRSVGELMQAASDLARKQPMLFFAGAVAAGFAAARFFKSSASGGSSENQYTPQHTPMSTRGFEGGPYAGT